MARLKSKHSALKSLSCKFGGLGKYTPLSPTGAEEMCNFRILPGGVLKTRMGYQLKKSFPSSQKVRGAWQGTLGDTAFLFVVAGNTVYRLAENTMTESVVGTISDGNGLVHFCVYKKDLYLLDGSNIYMYFSEQNKFKEIEAYVPLYGYQWHPESFGEVYEKINLLSRHLRIHYYNSDAGTVFQFPYYADAVDFVYINGRKSTKYTFSPGSNQITTTTEKAPTVVEVGITITLNEEIRQKLLASQLSFIYNLKEEDKLFLWGNDARVFCSAPVSDYMLTSCRVFYPDTSPLYFCSDDILFLGDSTHPVTAFCPFYNTILAFTADRIWNICFEKEGMEVKLATREMGCASPFGVIPYQNSVLAIIGKDIYRISASVARTDELTFERLSQGVEGRIDADYSIRGQLFWNVADDEIWIHDPQKANGEVLVWNTKSEEWYRFENISGSFFFKIYDGIGFAEDSNIFLFDRSYATDNHNPIAAFYRSSYLDFGTPDVPRRSGRAYLYFSAGDEEGSLLLETERNGTVFTLSSPPSNANTHLQEIRFGGYRYRFLRFTISANVSTPAEFYRLDIHTLP